MGVFGTVVYGGAGGGEQEVWGVGFVWEGC